MGREVTTTIKIDRRQAVEKVLLETNEIIVRGEMTRRFLFSAMRDLVHKDGWLKFSCDGHDVAIQLDGDAEAWLKRIKNPPSRMEKLRIKAGMKVHLAGDVEEGVAEEIAGVGAKVEAKLATGVDVVLFFIRKPAELSKLKSIEKNLAAGGAVWVLWPKGAAAEVRHEDVVAAAANVPLVQTISIGFSPTFTGLRLVRPAKQ